jgi:hypothetical protein
LNTSERFLQFANECEDMAHLSPTPVNKVVWRNLAHRWRRCAELSRGEDSTAYIDRLRRRHSTQHALSNTEILETPRTRWVALFSATDDRAARSVGVNGASRQMEGSLPGSPSRAQISMNGQTGRISGPSRKRIKSGLCGSIDPSVSTFSDQPVTRTVAPSERGFGGSSQTQQSSGVVLPPRRAMTMGGSQNKVWICSAMVLSARSMGWDRCCYICSRETVANGTDQGCEEMPAAKMPEGVR